MSRGPLLVTGGAGFLGRRVVRLAESSGLEVVAPARVDLDVRDAVSMLRGLAEIRPGAVVHLAYRPDERDTIVNGSGNVARAAAAVGARLVHLSTDVVFAGRPSAYTESDRTDPSTDYGRAKADAEAVVGIEHADAVLVRTSLLYSTDRDDPGPQVQLVRDALADPGSVTFYDDEVRCPALAEDVAIAVLALAVGDDRLAACRGPIHVAGASAATRIGFASAIATWMGGDPARLLSGPQPGGDSVRPGTVVLDCSAAAALGVRCRSVDEVLATRRSW